MSAPTLLIDAGNSYIKWCYASYRKTESPTHNAPQLFFDHVKTAPHDQWYAMLSVEKTIPSRVVFCDVSNAQLAHRLTELCARWSNCPLHCFNTAPIELLHSRYSAQLGADRAANALGLIAELYDENPLKSRLPTSPQDKLSVLIVSAGTATTIDCVHIGAQTAVFVGGFITPGFQLMQKSLMDKTAQLQPDLSASVNAQAVEKIVAPLSTQNDQEITLATNTTDAIQGGCLAAQIGALALIYDRVQPNCVYFTGGAGQWLMQQVQILRSQWRLQYRDNLCLKGLAFYASQTFPHLIT